MLKKLLILFYEMFKIALFVLGGGFAIIAVADEVFSRKLKWTEEGELIGHLPVFQMVPGLIAGNTAIYVGNKVAGALGAAVGLAAVALPSLIIFLFVSAGYGALPLDNVWLNAAFVGLRAALTGIVASTMIRSWTKCVKDTYGYAVLVLAAVAIGLLHLNPAFVLIAAMIVGICRRYLLDALAAHKKSRVFGSFAFIPLLFLKYGSLCFGGGYVLVPFYIRDFVGASAAYLQIAPDEFSNLMALTQMTPGPIGINAATFFGYRLGGVLGSTIATICLLLPSYFFLLLALRSLEKFKTSRFVQGLLEGVRPATVSLMLVALWAFLSMSVWDNSTNPHTSWCTFTAINFNVAGFLLALAAGILAWMKKLPVMRIVFLCALAALCLRA